MDPNTAAPLIAYPDVQSMISEECEFLRDLLLEKNRKYGNSAIAPSRIFSKADPCEQLKVRIDDKLSRIMNAQVDEDEDPVTDLLGYLILLKVALRVQKLRKL